MPSKKVTVVPTNSIASVFAKAKPVSAIKVTTETKTESKQDNALSSLDSHVQAFYDSLKPNERIAHEIAVEKLGTSYDVTRTHGFVKWRAAQPKI